MDYYIIAFSSITFAMRLKNHFKYEGDFVAVIHTPRSLGLNGCSYSVKVRKDKLNAVLKACQQIGITPKRTFRMRGNEYYEV